MSAEKENLLSQNPKKGSQVYYDEESNEYNTALSSILDEASSIDGIKTIIAILFIVFECIPIIMGGYILNNHYSLYFVGIFAISLFAVMCIAKEKFHYVLITVFMYAMYMIMLFAIAADAYKQENAQMYHIQKLKTTSVLWIILQFIIATLVYIKCCKPQQPEDQTIQEYD